MAERPQILLFGSSIVQHNFYDDGWGAMLRAFYARKFTRQVDREIVIIFGSLGPPSKAHIVQRGYAGWNSRRGLENLYKIVPKDATERPALMIIHFGGEDSTHPYHGLGPHVPLEEYIQNMRNIGLHIKRVSPKTRLIFLSTPPINEEQIPDNIDPEGNVKRTNEACQRYSEALLELCFQMNIKTIDLWSAIQTVDNWKDVCFIDGVNFTAKGSSIVIDEISKVLKESSWEPSLHWDSMPDEFGEDSPFDEVRLRRNKRSIINNSNNPFPEGLDWEKYKVLQAQNSKKP